MKPTKAGIEKWLQTQEKGRKPSKPRHGLVVNMLNGETYEAALETALATNPEGAKWRRLIEEGHAPPIINLFESPGREEGTR